MAATKQDISGWFDVGVAQGSTHLLVVCDTYDWEDYPVYAKDDDDARKQYQKFHHSNMQKVMEVYDLKKPMAPQMRGGRVFNY